MFAGGSMLVSSKVALAVGILTVLVATVCGWWWHYVLLRESKARTSSNKKAPLPPESLGLPLLGETLEFLRLTQADKSAEFLNPRVAKYGQVRAQNPNPFLVPPPLNPSFLPPIQFRFLSEVSRNPMPGIQFKLFGPNSLMNKTGEQHKNKFLWDNVYWVSQITICRFPS
ncbi:unnamed protein product [Sphagnum balticum]